MKTAIINTTIVMPDHLIPNATILLENGKIVDFGRKVSAEHCEVFDAKGAYTGPGLVDIHTHAGGEDLFSSAPEKASKLLLSHGVTTVLPALYFSSDRDMLIEEAKKIKKAADSGECNNIYGLYMEAPYMNPSFGANKESCPWRGDIKAEDYIPLLEALKGFAKVYALAPERENILDIVKDANGTRIETPKLIPTVTYYDVNRANLSIYFLDQFTEELASSHGTNAHGATSIRQLRSYVTSAIPKEFLPESYQ